MFLKLLEFQCLSARTDGLGTLDKDLFLMLLSAG